MEYKVTATIQALAADPKGMRINPPVTTPWYRGPSQAAAIGAVASNLADPETQYYEVLSVTVDMVRPEPAPWDYSPCLEG